MGGGSLLWDAPKGAALWFNDRNPMIMDYWLTLRDRESFIDEILEIRDQFQSANEAGKRDIFDDAKWFLDCQRRVLRKDYGWPQRTPTLDEFQSAKAKSEYTALEYIICNRLSVACIVNLHRNDICSYSKTFRRNGLDAVSREKLEQLRAVLRRSDCRLTCVDYSEVIEAPGDDVWMFLDPPYLMDSGATDIYELMFTMEQHIEMAKRLHDTRHRWLLTIGDSRISTRLYGDKNITWRRYTQSIPHKENNSYKTEMFIRNI